MNNDIMAETLKRITGHGQNTEAAINAELLHYISEIHSIASVEDRMHELRKDRALVSNLYLNFNENASIALKLYYKKKLQLIDALMSAFTEWNDKKPIQALFDFNLALATIIAPSDVVRRFDGTKIPVPSGEKARDLAWKNYCRLGNDIAQFLSVATKEDIDKKLASLTPVDLKNKNSNLQIANNIITGEMSQDDAASFCYIMGMLCNIDYGYDVKQIRHSKEFVYNAYATTFGSVSDLQKLYDELVAPRNQLKIPTTHKKFSASEQE